jgi:lysophospholipase L1-like esterase
MADTKKILEHHPAMADFRLSDLIGFRGDVLTYWANFQRDSFSTNAQGFRHSTFGGKTMSVVDCTQSERYGIVLGASNIFGVGLAGNENALASLLAERFGFPFANAAMPGGNSRNLQALLIGLMAGARQPPAVVVLSNGGDLANFCEATFVDPIFGSPNHVQLKAISDLGQSADPDRNFQRLMVFTSLWTSATATLCRARKTPLVMVHQSTFFEKTQPSSLEKECALGRPRRPAQKTLLERFRKYNAPFFAKRKELAERFKIPLAGVDTELLTFVDEFHLDRDGTRTLAKAVGDAIEPLLSGGKPKAKKVKA